MGVFVAHEYKLQVYYLYHSDEEIFANEPGHQKITLSFVCTHNI
jgi:hypothetical protein